MFCNKYRPTENVVARAREVAEVTEAGIVAQPRAQLVPGGFGFHARKILGGQFCTAECFDVFVHNIILLFIWVQNYKIIARITNENSL